MKKLLVFFITTLPLHGLQAQYYYSDIVANAEASLNYQLLKKHGISKVTVSALEADGTAAEGFFLEQDLQGATLTTRSRSAFSDASILQSRFDAQARLQYTYDSSVASNNKIQYTYDEAGRLLRIETQSMQDGQQQYIIGEVRQYVYRGTGTVPVEMQRIAGKDTLYVRFNADANGLPATETWYKDGRKTEAWYYYYDEAGRISDIVRFSDAAGRMLPDYLFGYNAQGQVTSKVAVQPGTGVFRVWQYYYDARGLKTEETVMNKQRKPEGKLVYTYR